jgi:hypothetical protein
MQSWGGRKVKGMLKSNSQPEVEVIRSTQNNDENTKSDNKYSVNPLLSKNS